MLLSSTGQPLSGSEKGYGIYFLVNDLDNIDWLLSENEIYETFYGALALLSGGTVNGVRTSITSNTTSGNNGYSDLWYRSSNPDTYVCMETSENMFSSGIYLQNPVDGEFHIEDYPNLSANNNNVPVTPEGTISDTDAFSNCP